MFTRSAWKKNEQAQFLIDLGECLTVGYPLKSALELQAERRPRRLASGIREMIRRLEQGAAFSESLRGRRFPKDVLHVIYFAEQSGKLAEALIENGESMLKRERYMRTLRRVVRYPLVLVWIVLLILYVIGQFLLPNFIRLYHSLSIELPLITRVILYLAEHFLTIISVLLGLVLVIGAGVRIWWRGDLLSRIALMARVPFIRSFVTLHYTYHCAFQMAGLLNSGMNMEQVIGVLAKDGGSPFLRLEALRMEKKLHSGASLEEAVTGVPYYLPELKTVIEQGSFQGALAAILRRFSNELMKRMEQKTEALLSLCQPVLLVIIGGVVLLLFLSILLPIFQMLDGL